MDDATARYILVAYMALVYASSRALFVYTWSAWYAIAFHWDLESYRTAEEQGENHVGSRYQESERETVVTSRDALATRWQECIHS
jgi:hypothetical protein